MKLNGTHALIVGIDEYDSPNLSPLAGARNDAASWYRFCVRHLGIQPENIAVLTHPQINPRDLGPEAERSRFRGASRQEIVEEAQVMARAASDGGAGFLTFSGHGLAVAPTHAGSAETDLALCPSDVSVELPEGADTVVKGSLRFSDLAEIFRAQDSKDNITVFLDTCYSSGPAAPPAAKGAACEPGAPEGTEAAAKAPPSKGPFSIRPKTPFEGLERARKVLKVDAFTNRLILGARHWTEAYEIKAGGQWRGAASFALQTVMERWALRQEDGVTYPNVSHADLLERMRDFLDVLGVPQTPAIWGQRRLDEMPVLRPGLRFLPGETSPHPNAPTNRRQVPVNPDKVGLLQFADQNGNRLIRVVVVGENVPSGISGVNARTEYWYTKTPTSPAPPPTPSKLYVSYDETDDQETLDAFVSGYQRSIMCAQLIGQENWEEWGSGDNSDGNLYRSPDPAEQDNYMGLYLKWQSNGLLATYAWYRTTLLTDGMAFNLNAFPSQFNVRASTDPNEAFEPGAWKYSLLLPPP